MFIGRDIGQEHFPNTIEFRARISNGLAVLAGDQEMDWLGQRLGGGQSLVGGVLECLVVVLSQKQRRHQRTPASFSLPTSSPAVFTFTPALRPAGSTVL